MTPGVSLRYLCRSLGSNPCEKTSLPLAGADLCPDLGGWWMVDIASPVGDDED